MSKQNNLNNLNNIIHMIMSWTTPCHDDNNIDDNGLSRFDSLNILNKTIYFNSDLVIS